MVAFTVCVVPLSVRMVGNMGMLAVVGLDRMIREALANSPEERTFSGQILAEAVRRISLAEVHRQRDRNCLDTQLASQLGQSTAAARRR